MLFSYALIRIETESEFEGLGIEVVIKDGLEVKMKRTKIQKGERRCEDTKN